MSFKISLYHQGKHLWRNGPLGFHARYTALPTRDADHVQANTMDDLVHGFVIIVHIFVQLLFGLPQGFSSASPTRIFLPADKPKTKRRGASKIRTIVEPRLNSPRSSPFAMKTPKGP